MSEPRIVVLDASVGVKWFKSEPGNIPARDLLAGHNQGHFRIVVPALFMAEVVAVATRHDPQLGREVWSLLRDADLTVLSLDDAVAEAAFAQCRVLGCDFYDALAPALATILDATLYSADRKAHARYPGVVLLG